MTVKGQLVQAGDGTAIPAGFVGETKTGTCNRTFSSNGGTATGWALNQNVTELTLGPGKWQVSWKLIVETTSGSTSGQLVAVLSTDTSDGWAPTSNLSNGGTGVNRLDTNSGGSSADTTVDILTLTAASTNVRAKVYRATHTTWTGKYEVYMTALRIA